MNVSLLSSHLFPTTDEHFSFLLDFVNQNNKFFGLRIMKVVAHQPAMSSFEQHDTKLPSEISRFPYFWTPSRKEPW